MTKEKTVLSPNVWLRLFVADEIEIDSDGSVLNENALKRFQERLSETEANRTSMIKAVVVADFILALLLANISLDIPGIGHVIDLKEIPAIKELLALYASAAFMFFGLVFFNYQSYEGVIQAAIMGNKSSKHIDPNLIFSSYVGVEWFLYLFKSQLSYKEDDRYLPGCGYKIFYGAVRIFLVLSMFGLMSLHFACIGAVFYSSQIDGIIFYLGAVTIGLLHFCGLAMIFTPSFKFAVREPPES